MIEVKINLIPFGNYEQERQIGYIKIWNDGTGTAGIGNYGYEINDDYGRLVTSGEYKGFYRRKGVFLLLNEILDEIHQGT